MNLRMARPEDAWALLEIYRPYIATTVTFEYVCPSLEEFQGRIVHTLERYPYLVLEEESRMLGYAYAHPLAQRAAYGWSAELSIYLEKQVRGRALGARLYGALMELLSLQGVRTACALVSSPNPHSEAFHEKMGFACTGLQERVGYKNGRWLGLSFYQKAIGPYDREPRPVRVLGELSEEEITQVLERYSVEI
ncbi:N-acetyltransferase family protein [Lawsonibacter sp. LCP25S3_G6]|uniref:GNAT family N-acetyltransferase n=1 Tax=unclassified Lawsonibacter TaxID=2617946 RepID=UPI003F95D2C0